MNKFETFEDADLTIEEHHRHPAMGSTDLKSYLSDSKPAKSSADVGNAVHLLATEPDRCVDQGLVIKKPTFSGKGSVALREDWEAQHKGVYYFPPAELARVHGMASALRNCRSLRFFLEHTDSQIEHTVLAKSDTGLWVKARPDIRGPGVFHGAPCRIIVDVKTTGEKDDDGFAKSVGSHGYDIQAALYGDIEHHRHELPVLYYLYGVLKTPGLDGKHKVMRMRVPESWMDVGRKKYGAAMVAAEYERKLSVRPPFHWEGDRVLPSPPPWVLMEAERIESHGRELAEVIDAQ